MLTIPRRSPSRATRPGRRFEKAAGSGAETVFPPTASNRPVHDAAPNHVLAHFADVAISQAPVSIQLPSGDVVHGRLGFPQLETMTAPFWVPEGGRLPEIEEGMVQLRYETAGAAFSLGARVRPRWQGLMWQIRVPPSMSAERVRLATRYRMPGWYMDFRTSGVGMVGFNRLIDLSTNGVSLLTEPTDRLLRPGRVLTGTLVGPRAERVAVRATVRRLDTQLDERVQLGCSFEHIGFQNVVRIANILRQNHGGKR